MFTDGLLTRCEQVMREDFGAGLREFNGEPDHVHLLVHYPPTFAPSRRVNSLKGVSSRRLRQEHIGKINRARTAEHGWAPSSFAPSCGGAPLEIVKEYLRGQKRPDRGREDASCPPRRTGFPRPDHRMSFAPVGDRTTLARLADYDAWVRFGLPAPAQGWRGAAWYDPGGGAVAVVRTRRPYGTSLIVLPARGQLSGDVVTEAVRLAPDARSVTAPQADAAAVLAAFTPSGPGASWDWMWTTTPPPPVPGEADVLALDDTDPAVAAELTSLLREHNPRHSAPPGSPDVAGWAGVRRDGRLVACAAWLRRVPPVPLLASVAVHPRARRHGLGAAITAWIARRELATGVPAVTVDLYADNDRARRLYARAGFRVAHTFTSWPR